LKKYDIQKSYNNFKIKLKIYICESKRAPGLHCLHAGQGTIPSPHRVISLSTNTSTGPNCDESHGKIMNILISIYRTLQMEFTEIIGNLYEPADNACLPLLLLVGRSESHGRDLLNNKIT